QVNAWLTTTDADADAMTYYQFWDDNPAGTSGYFSTPTNSHSAAGTPIMVAASDLANVWVHGGQTAGTDTMWVRAFDGTDWGAWQSFTLTTLPNVAPQVTIANHSLRQNQWAQVNTWLGTSDAEGDPITQYQFWDDGTGATSGYFWTPDNAHWAAGQ